MKTLQTALWASLILAGCQTTKAAPEKTLPAEPPSTTITVPVEIVTAPAIIEVVPPKSQHFYQPVCSIEIPTDRPSWETMLEHFPNKPAQNVFDDIGGKVKVNGNLLGQSRWTNACAVRVSEALNLSGYKIPAMRGKTVSGDEDKGKMQYIYRVRDMLAHLEKNFGPADKKFVDSTGTLEALGTDPGVIVMVFDVPGVSYGGHATLYNGIQSIDGASISAGRVYFWALPCENKKYKDPSLPTSDQNKFD